MGKEPILLELNGRKIPMSPLTTSTKRTHEIFPRGLTSVTYLLQEHPLDTISKFDRLTQTLTQESSYFCQLNFGPASLCLDLLSTQTECTFWLPSGFPLTWQWCHGCLHQRNFLRWLVRILDLLSLCRALAKITKSKIQAPKSKPGGAANEERPKSKIQDPSQGP